MSMGSGDQISRCLQIIVYYRNHSILPWSNAHHITFNEVKVGIGSNFPIGLHMINLMSVREEYKYWKTQWMNYIAKIGLWYSLSRVFNLYKEIMIGRLRK